MAASFLRVASTGALSSLVFSACLLILCLLVSASPPSTPRPRPHPPAANSNANQVNRCVGNYDSQDGLTLPTGRPIRWAIVSLTRPNDARLKIRNAAIVEKIKPFATKHDITAVFFSELPIPDEVVKEWRRTFEPANIKLQIINTAALGFYNLPSEGGSDALPQKKSSSSSDTISYGYKYMCKFFAVDMYSHLKNFDFYLRVDSDCYFKNLKYDIFQWAEDNNLGYGYIARKLEAHGPTKQTLPLWTQKYAQKCAVHPKLPMEQPMSSCFNFYNNFHIGRVSFFNRPEVMDFLKAANESGRILSHRWGDSTIQAYAVRMFMDPPALLRIPNVTYVHGSHANMIVSSVEGVVTNLPQMLPLFDGVQYNQGELWKAMDRIDRVNKMAAG